MKAGFKVNSRTSEGTALHEAALRGKVDVVKALLDAGIDVCVADSARRTAVDRLNEVGLKTPVAKEIAELIRGKKFSLRFLSNTLKDKMELKNKVINYGISVLLTKRNEFVFVGSVGALKRTTIELNRAGIFHPPQLLGLWTLHHHPRTRSFR